MAGLIENMANSVCSAKLKQRLGKNKLNFLRNYYSCGGWMRLAGWIIGRNVQHSPGELELGLGLSLAKIF